MMEQSKIKALFDKKKIYLKKFVESIQPYWNQLLAKPRHEQILLVFTIEAILAVVVVLFTLPIILALSFITIEKILTTTGVWTLITLLISSPIAFFVWKFRDENTVHQLENQRKDVNLKEFQKIAEWVSGLHLVEDKIVERTKKIETPVENNSSRQEGNQEETTDTTPETETSREYGEAGQSRHIPSHSRQDGAVGLQVAAVYMLKPFYCGDHGDGFRKPALNLLTSAWLALFKQVEDDEENNQKPDSEKLKNSPLAIALTEVLLADGGIHLRRYPEVFPNLYLPYLNLHLSGLDKEVLKLLSEDLNCSRINLKYAYLKMAELNGAKLSGAKLNGTKLNGAKLNEAKLTGADLTGADLNGAKLNGADLISANLNGANLNKAKLDNATLNNAKLNNATLNKAKLNNAKLKGAALKGADLTGAELKNEADLNGADLKGAKLAGAKLDGTKLNGTKLDGANFYLAQLFNIRTNHHTSWRGALFDTDNIQEICTYLDDESLKWIIQVPKLAAVPKARRTLFKFERNGYQYVHQIPRSLTVEKLQELNPQWIISLKE
ncbi:pentapeptide repeat-containing protein [Neisseria sp. Dent CA1/247]|uniref:pentapeptide repeat-containing protein n=1 Tax=Neisseria sp. Dent CA1/247 TaxID=2912675 RepID=UPI001FD16244|nr:pentapeptide repeat-containing protein [Neisseria sp. Dent CA1/247]UOO76642.1 pentapeptide repeat-containing protein [Neisseria sp. Dent CA1/247]